MTHRWPRLRRILILALLFAALLSLRGDEPQPDSPLTPSVDGVQISEQGTKAEHESGTVAREGSRHGRWRRSPVLVRQVWP